ncbi:unnamed protein product [Closterium sp. NIES-64]|nr:unnamed protein product [Closterium sp. NIES-64]
MAAPAERRAEKRVPRCIKCRAADAAALVNQTEALCAGCLRGALLGKFKSAVNSGKLVAKDDHVLLAFSGGAASRCALDFLLAIQSPLLHSQGAAPLGAQGAAARGRIPFRLSVAYVDERVAVGNDLLPRGTADRLACELREIVSDAVAAHRGARDCSGGDCGEGGGRGAAREGGAGSENGGGHGVAFHVVRLESALADGGSAPADGGSAPADGESAPADGESAPADGESAPADGESAPADGGSAPADGGGAPMEGDGGDGESRAEGLASRLAVVVGGAAEGTGREDVVGALRLDALMLLVVSGALSFCLAPLPCRSSLPPQLAQRLRCSKVVVGSTASRLAAHTIAATAKAQGFALPADLAVWDARRGVPVVRPLRDCSLRDLALLAHLHCLRTAFAPSLATRASLRGGAGSGATGGAESINALAAWFLEGLQRESSGRQFTVTRTALKLQPFPFNLPPSLAPPSPTAADSPPPPLCAICLAPLPPSALAPPLPPEPPASGVATAAAAPSLPLSPSSSPLCCSCRWGVVGAGEATRMGGKRGTGGAERGRENGEGGRGEVEGGGGGAGAGGAGGVAGLPEAFLARGRAGSASYSHWLRQCERSMIADCLLEGD